MARKFHVTPDGPKPCKAKKGGCPYSHYDTKDGAEIAYQMQEKAKVTDARVRELAQKINDLPDDKKKIVNIDFDNRGSDYARNIGNEIERHYRDTQKRPEFVQGSFNATLDNPGPWNYGFNARKNYVVAGRPAKIIPTWTLEITKDSETIETVDCPLMTSAEGRHMKREAYRLVTEATSKGWPNDKSQAQRKRREVLDSFINVVKTTETEERGAEKAQQVDFSYFKDSTDTEIIAKADYSETTFRARSIEDALKDSRYDDVTPDVSVVLQDSRAKTSLNYWTLAGKNNSWVIHKTYEDGRNETVGPFSDPQVAYDTITDFTTNNMSMSKKRSEDCGNTAASIVASIEGLRKKHAGAVEARRRVREAEKQSKKANSELFGHNNEGMFSKISKLFA